MINCDSGRGEVELDVAVGHEHDHDDAHLTVGVQHARAELSNQSSAGGHLLVVNRRRLAGDVDLVRAVEHLKKMSDAFADRISWADYVRT